MIKSNQNDDVLINRLQLLLDAYDCLNHLECDGLTQVFHRILSDEKIQHTVNIGQVIYQPTNQKIPLHYWIEVEGLQIDYRLRMWFGETSNVPHGVFFKDSQRSVSYFGEPIELPILPLPIIQILIKTFNI